MIMSPGVALSIAVCSELPVEVPGVVPNVSAVTFSLAMKVGFLPPIVTVTASTERFPDAVVTTSSPQRAVLFTLAGAAVYTAYVGLVALHSGTVVGTVTVIVPSSHAPVATVAVTPPIVTVPGVEPKP